MHADAQPSKALAILRPLVYPDALGMLLGDSFLPLPHLPLPSVLCGRQSIAEWL